MEKELKHSEKKAYEIAYALFRIAGIVRNNGIAEYLEAGALKYLRAIILMDTNSANESSRELEFYLRIGQDLNFIHPENAQAVIVELRELNEHIAESVGAERAPESLRLVFSGKEVKPNRGRETLQDIKISLDNINKQIEILSTTEQEDDIDLVEAIRPMVVETQKEPKKIGLKIEKQKPDVTINEVAIEEPKINIFNGETRQMAIYELIRRFDAAHRRQSGNEFGKESGNGCRMRDLQESFTGVSERTIRYDLEKLIEMGLIERAGQSGPSTFYRVKQLVNSH